MMLKERIYLAKLIGGFDPSMSNFGMVKGTYDGSFLVSEVSLVQTKPSKVKQVRKNSSDLDRARELYLAMQEFFSDVDVICVEIPHGSQSARAMASYGICIGLLASLDKPLIQISATENKKAALGKPNGTKEEMIEWGKATHPEAPWFNVKSKDEHIADAMSAVHAAESTDMFKLLLRN